MIQLIIKSALELLALAVGLAVLENVHGTIKGLTDEGGVVVLFIYVVLLVRFRFLNYKRKE